MLGGLDMPIFTALGGLIWIAGKVSYSRGYYTGDPKNRYGKVHFDLLNVILTTNCFLITECVEHMHTLDF